MSYFEGFQLSKGKLFKICYYERQNQAMIEIKGPELVMETDFPKVDFYGKFGRNTFKK